MSSILLNLAYISFALWTSIFIADILLCIAEHSDSLFLNSFSHSYLITTIWLLNDSISYSNSLTRATNFPFSVFIYCKSLLIYLMFDSDNICSSFAFSFSRIDSFSSSMIFWKWSLYFYYEYGFVFSSLKFWSVFICFHHYCTCIYFI